MTALSSACSRSSRAHPLQRSSPPPDFAPPDPGASSGIGEETALLLAHEFAHNVCFANGVSGPDHGPIWLGVYIDLLDWFKILPRCMTEPSARKAGLKFKAPPF